MHLWDVAERKPKATLRRTTSNFTATAFIPGGRLFATGHKAGNLNLWDMSTRERVTTLAGHQQQVSSIAASPDGTLLATGPVKDGPIKLWTTTKGPAPPSIEGGSDVSKNISTAARVRQWASATDDSADKRPTLSRKP